MSELGHSLPSRSAPGPTDVRHTLAAPPALPELSPLLWREPSPCLHTHTSSSGKIRRCCVDQLNPPPKATFQGKCPNGREVPQAAVKSGFQAGFISIMVRAKCAWVAAPGAAQVITAVTW